MAVFSGSRPRRFARLLPVPLAGYAARDLFASATHGMSAMSGLVSRSGFGALWIVFAVALGSALLLREMGRGLPARVPRPRWSGRFFGLWLLCSGVSMVCFSCEELWRVCANLGTHGGLVPIVSTGGWSSIAASLVVGLLAATSLRCAGWAVRSVIGWLRPRLAAVAGAPTCDIRAALRELQRLAPVADGWSSRGPPLRTALAVNLS